MTEAELLSGYLAGRDVPCPGCGYSLLGLTRPVCPECGSGLALKLVATSTPAPEPEAERARLREYLASRDVACPTCRRNLRGHDGLACPGCGREISVWMLRLVGVERPVPAALGVLVRIGLVGLAGALIVAALLVVTGVW